MKRTLLYVSALLLSLFGTQFANAQQCVPSLTPNSILLCPNETDTLWSDPHNTYQWLQDGVPLPGQTNQYFVVDPMVVGGSMISVVTTTTGCTGTDTSDEVLADSWNFLPPFVANITDTKLCAGIADSVVFDLSLDSNVQWYFNGLAIPGATNDTFVAYQEGLYTVEGAPSVCPTFVMPLGLDLAVDSNAAPVITPSSQTICPGDFASLATTLATYDSYEWFVNGQAVMNSNIPSFITFDGGYYHVVTDEDGCILASDSAQVIIHPPVTPVIIWSNNTLVSVPGGSQLSNFQWYLNGNPIPGANDSTYIPSFDGSYTVAAFDGTCNDTSAAYQYAVSVNDTRKTISFRLYPNPAQGDIYINSAEAVSVMILDNVGRVVYTEMQAEKNHHILLHQLAAGVYTIKLTGKDHTAYEKIVLE